MGSFERTRVKNERLYRFCIVLITFLTTHLVGLAQIDWATFVENYIYNNEENSQQTELIYEQLNELRLNPLDLNTASAEQLLQIPLLNEKQVEDIIKYRDKNFPIHTTGELMYVESLNKEEREIIQLFCIAGEIPVDQSITFKNVFKRSRNEAYIRTDIPFYTKVGQRDGTYRGSRFQNKIRYTFRSMNHFYAGVQTEKDAGERGYDYIAAYGMLKDLPTGKNGQIRELIAGNFRANFGLGLAVNTAISYGKNMQADALSSIDKGFSPHSSFIESNYLSGGAFRYRYKKFTIAAFGAFNKLDANYNKDSTGVTSLKTDGYHRTALEYSKRHNLEETNWGGNLHFDFNRLEVSATAMYTHFNIPLTPTYNTASTLYRAYDANGKDFGNYSLSYLLKLGKLSIIGETALSHMNSGQTGFATLNGVQFRPNKRNKLNLIYRNYGAKYTTIHAHAFSENSKPQNEHAIYLSWTSALTEGLDIYTYLDLMRFPWLKSSVSAPSYGVDFMAQATYFPNKVHRWLLRYHMKTKQKDFTTATGKNNTTALYYNTRHTVKAQHTAIVHPKLTLVTTINGICITFAKNSPEMGFSLSESAKWNVIPNLLRLNFSFIYVDTDTYNARVYNYEPSLLYSFGINSYYYQAMRGIIMANVTPLRGLTVTARYSITKYLDHDTIGTGKEQIESSLRSDLQLLLRYTF